MSFGHPRSHYCIVGLWTVIMCVRSFDLSRTHVRAKSSQASRSNTSHPFLAVGHERSRNCKIVAFACIPCSWSRIIIFRPNPRDCQVLNALKSTKLTRNQLKSILTLPSTKLIDYAPKRQHFHVFQVILVA